jgi:hypothetical protein
VPYKPVAKKKVTAPKGGGKAATGEKLYTPVSQATIDKIKKMGMTKALAAAGKTPKGARAEFIQGVTRMYGAKRVAAARTKAAPAAKSPDAARAAYSKAKPVAAAKPKAKATTKASASKSNWRKTGIGPVIKKNIKSGDWRKKGLLG